MRSTMTEAGIWLAKTLMISVSILGTPACLKPCILSAMSLAVVSRLLTSWNSSQDLEMWGLPGVSIDEIGDKSIKQDNEHSPECVAEEQKLSVSRQPLGKRVECVTDSIEQEQSSKAHCCIVFGASKMLQSVNHDLVSSITGRESSDTHQGWDLTDSDVDGRSGHECGDRGERNEVDNPAESRKTNETDNSSCDDGKCRGDDMCTIRVHFVQLRVSFRCLDYHVSGDCRHDGDWANGDVL